MSVVITLTYLQKLGAPESVLRACEEVQQKVGEDQSLGQYADWLLRRGYADEAQWLLVRLLDMSHLDAWLVRVLGDTRSLTPASHRDLVRYAWPLIRKGNMGALGPVFWIAWEERKQAVERAAEAKLGEPLTLSERQALLAFKLASQLLPATAATDEGMARAQADFVINAAWAARVAWAKSKRDASAFTARSSILLQAHAQPTKRTGKVKKAA